MKEFKLQLPEKLIPFIRLLMTLTAYYKIGDGNRPFHVKASDYEKSIKSNDFLPKDIELVRFHNGIAYAASKSSNCTLVWIPIILEPKGAIGFCLKGLMDEFPDNMEEDPLFGYAFNVDVLQWQQLNLYFDL